MQSVLIQAHKFRQISFVAFEKNAFDLVCSWRVFGHWGCNCIEEDKLSLTKALVSLFLQSNEWDGSFLNVTLVTRTEES
jgi:hypothetical protein